MKINNPHSMQLYDAKATPRLLLCFLFITPLPTPALTPQPH